MSTYFHLRCTSHTPYIRSDGLGNNCEETIVAMHTHRDAITQLFTACHELTRRINHILVTPSITFDIEPAANTAAFLVQHPTCDLELWDEYGHQWCLTCAVAMEAHEGKVLCQQYEVTQYLCASCNGSVTS